MAADVLETPGFGKETSRNFNESVSKASGPFRATQIWNEIIDHLKENVHIKRRKILMKRYDQSFTGTDAVDVVLHQLLTDKDNFPNKDITREKAIKLCQFMLDQEVFEQVNGHKSEEKVPSFDDSPSKLYRFLEDKENDEDSLQCHNCQELSKPDDHDSMSNKDYCLPGSHKSSSSVSSLLHRNQSVVQELLELTGTWKRRNSDIMKRKLTPARLFTVGAGANVSGPGVSRVSLPGAGMGGGYMEDNDRMDDLDKLTPEVEDELMREHALAQLLTLLDIPILDNILSYESASTKPTSKQKTYSNLGFRRCESVASMYSSNSDKEDMWWDSAIECIDALPKGLDMLDISLGEKSDLTQKLRLYQSIADHYASLEEPLWSENFIDIHVGLLNLLMQGRRDLVLKGLCLSVVLLPIDIREELKRLLKFLYQAVSAEAISLCSTGSTRSLIERVFTPVIIRNKLFAPHQAGQLVLFMIDNVDQLWDAPDEVEEAVRKSLLELQEGKEKLTVVKTYCKQVTQEEFRRQQEEFTEKCMVDLMNTILDNTKMTLKDKKQKLKHLQKHHPKLYWKHFSDML